MRKGQKTGQGLHGMRQGAALSCVHSLRSPLCSTLVALEDMMLKADKLDWNNPAVLFVRCLLAHFIYRPSLNMRAVSFRVPVWQIHRILHLLAAAQCWGTQRLTQDLICLWNTRETFCYQTICWGSQKRFQCYISNSSAVQAKCKFCGSNEHCLILFVSVLSFVLIFLGFFGGM